MTTVGKVLGALGALILLTAPLTYVFVTGEGWVSLAKAAIGVLLILVYLATNWKQLGQFASGKATFFAVSSVLMSLLVAGSLVAVNVIAAKRNKTWDLTNKKIHSLSPQTASTLSALKEKVTVLAFVDNTNPYYAVWEGILQRYRQQQPDKFDYAFKDPNKNPDLAKKYQIKAGQMTVVAVRGEGENASHTAVAAPFEQEVTNALIKLSQVTQQKVYFTTGHGEWVLDASPDPQEAMLSLSELKKELFQEGYQPEALNLVGLNALPRDTALVVVAGARSPFSAPEVQVLRKYLDQGGRLVFFAEPGVGYGPELEKLLAEHGFQLDPGIIADSQYHTASPYTLLSTPEQYAEHELTRMLKAAALNVQLPTARGITVLREGLAEGVRAEHVILTSRFAWEESTPNETPSPSSGEKAGSIPLVAVSTRPTTNAEAKRFEEGRIVVFGDADLVVNQLYGYDPNRNLILNALGWASSQVQKITIRPPDRDISTLDLDKDRMGRIRFVATDLLPLSLLGIGLAIWFTRRSK